MYETKPSASVVCGVAVEVEVKRPVLGLVASGSHLMVAEGSNANIVLSGSEVFCITGSTV